MSNDDNLLKPEDMLFGPHVERLATKLKGKHVATNFLKKAKSAFVQCLKYMQKKVPLKNRVLSTFSALDPLARGHSVTLKHLKQLPEHLPTVLTEEAVTGVQREIHLYQTDPKLPNRLNSEVKEHRIDQWWNQVAQGGSYPKLTRLVKAAISCFHGAQVESSF